MENRISKNPVVIGSAAIVCLLLGWYWLPFLFFPFALLFRLKKILDTRDNIYQFPISIIFCITGSIILIKILEGALNGLTLIQAFTLPFAFILFGFLDRKLPDRFSHFIIVLFWLSCQYIFIKFAPDQSLFFLSNAPSIPSSWMRWNTYTGFMGGSFWILMINLFVFQSFFREGKVNWLQVFFLIAAILIPIVISRNMSTNPIILEDMIGLYTGNKVDNKEYISIGELIPRTAVWISVLIIIFTFVKAKTTKIR